ncbi:MAG: hypothetical protein ACREQI_07380 [Candidatus Binataceae bacterium]
MKTATLDTCAVIAVFNPERPGHTAMCRIKDAWERGRVRLAVSRRTLYQLRKKPPDAALAFAEKLEIQPYYVIGSWEEQGDVTWAQCAGTWDDAKKMDELQRVFPVRAGADIFGRGILLDSMKARIQVLVTNDGDVLAKPDDVERITGVRPMKPEEAARISIQP